MIRPDRQGDFDLAWHRENLGRPQNLAEGDDDARVACPEIRFREQHDVMPREVRHCKMHAAWSAGSDLHRNADPVAAGRHGRVRGGGWRLGCRLLGPRGKACECGKPRCSRSRWRRERPQPLRCAGQLSCAGSRCFQPLRPDGKFQCREFRAFSPVDASMATAYGVALPGLANNKSPVTQLTSGWNMRQNRR